MPVRGQNFSTSAGQNPLTCPENYPQQNQERIQPTRKSKINFSTPNCDSAIGTHLLKHPNCALHYNNNQFSILSKARSEFHLAVLESIHITSSKPALYRQKEFVYRLKLST